MSKGTRLAALLLLTTSLTFPAALHAQSTEPSASDTTEPSEETAQQPDISIPGGGIIVTGRRNRNIERAATQVLTVLSEQDIARTGEGDIAGALGRVSGLSLVGDGRVFVRGLGDRYSLALLNGLPLPSPEPLSRVVPLDIFPTSVVSSSIVQKTYSANFPGEFGGGVINLTTKAIPLRNFLDVSVSAGGDTLTTFQNGLTYFGSNWDSLGFDNGNRDIPSNLAAFLASGNRISDLTLDQQGAIAGQLMPTNLVTLQRVDSQRPNLGGTVTAGLSTDLSGDVTLGIIATASIRNRLRNRTVRNETGNSDLTEVLQSFTTFITDESVLVDGLLGFGLDIGDHTIRWTNLYIRDSLKTARLAEGNNILFGVSGFDFLNQQTAWFERQLIDSQLVTELKFDKLKVDLRGGFARTNREAPYNANISYARTNIPGNPFGEQFVAYFSTQIPNVIPSTVAFDDLQEDLLYGGVDLTYEFLSNFSATVGYAYTDTERRSSSRDFRPLIAPGRRPELGPDVVNALGLRRPGDIINGATLAGFNVTVTEATPFPVFDASLLIHAGYGLVRWAPIDRVTIDAGVRFEDAKQNVALDQSIFSIPIEGAFPTNLAESYFLPGGTITWEATDNLQLRASASKTIARPQFRELVEQTYFDPESNRRFRGNPFLVDSQLLNLETRAEYYFGGPRKVSVAAFFKEIDRPIESFLTATEGGQIFTFANAPSATLYGAEVDFSYGFDIANWGGAFFENKQILVLANYTFTKSRLRVGADDISPFPGNVQQLSSFIFDDGVAMVGQSDHIANLSLGIEDKAKVQQATFLFNYASQRVTARGGPLPDVIEVPGLVVDFVARSEVKLGAQPVELSFEVRNIFGRYNFEFQELEGRRIDINTFRVGTAFAVGLKAKF